MPRAFWIAIIIPLALTPVAVLRPRLFGWLVVAALLLELGAWAILALGQ
jgi:hypothetical protein